MRAYLSSFVVFGFLVTAAAPGAAEGPWGPDTPEPGSVEAIAAATTDPAFVSPWVSYVPESTAIPSPTDYLGRIAGAPGELAGTEEIYGYLRALADASDRVHLERIGTSSEGREIVLVAVSDAASIARLDELRDASARLADPRLTSPEEAETLIESARPFYYLNSALHADETGSSEMAMELVYRLVVSEQPFIREIRDEVVVLVNPVSNPDGRDKMVDWFYRHLKGKTDYASLPRQSPPYWGKYLFVDANRDAHQLSQPETRAVRDMFFRYHPVVVHDLHEAIALLQTWNGTGPYNPHLDPIVLSEFLEMSFHEMTTMAAFGMPGVWTWDFGEGYGHHYLDSIGMNHNAIGRGYETYGNATAETVERVLEPWDLTREWYRPWPPPGPRLVWSMRNNTNYMQTGVLAILDYTARQAKPMLRQFYRKGYNSWRRGVEGNPSAFVIPAGQADPRSAADMVERLLTQGIEVSRAVDSFEAAGERFPAGSFVVPLDQPYRNYAVDLLTPQEFPSGTEKPPYDDVSWALPVHYGVRTVRVDDPRVRDVGMEPVTSPVRVEGLLHGSGPVFLLADRGQESLLAARYRLRDFAVEAAEEPFTADGVEYPAGSWILPPGEDLREALGEMAEELGLEIRGTGAVPDVSRHALDVPRLGVWVPWADTDSIGWIRYTLDRQGIPYTYLRDEEIRAGGLRDRVDVIVYGNVDLDLAGQIHGIPADTGPLAFTRTEAFASHGTPAASEDITGGIGFEGLANLQRFVEEGGVLATLGNGSTLALDGGLVRFLRRDQDTEVFTPGAELRATFLSPRHPIAYGYGDHPTIFRQDYPVYERPRAWHRMAYCTACLDGPVDESGVVLAWGEEGSPMVVSGGALSSEELAGRPAILATPVGEGVVVTYNFNPLHRDLNRSDHRFLWNAILNWRHLR